MPESEQWIQTPNVLDRYNPHHILADHAGRIDVWTCRRCAAMISTGDRKFIKLHDDFHAKLDELVAALVDPLAGVDPSSPQVSYDPLGAE